MSEITDWLDKSNPPADNTDFGYGRRPDGTNKGLGYFGEVQRRDGTGFSTELTADAEFDGQTHTIPLMVPTLSREELDALVNDGPITDPVLNKAVDHARMRIAQGKSPYAQPGEQPAAPKQSEFADWLQADPEQERLGLSVKEGSTRNPSEATRLLQLQTKTGLPKDFIAENLDLVEGYAIQKDFNPDLFRQKSPALAKWIAEHPDNAAASQEDWSKLSYLERQYRYIGGNFERGKATVALADLGFKAMSEPLSADERKRQAELEGVLSKTDRTDITGFFEQIPGMVAQQAPILGRTLAGKAKDAALGGAAGAAAGSVVPAVGTATGAITGATIGWKYGAALEAGKMEAALAFLDYEKLKDEHGQPLDRTTVVGLAGMVGVINGALEGLTGLESAADKFPWVRNFTKDGLKQLLYSPTVRGALLGYAKAVGSIMVTEGVTEGLQSLVTSAGKTFAKASGGPTDIMAEIFSDANLTQAMQEARAGAQGGGGLGVAIAAPSLVADIHKAKRAKENEQAFLDIGGVTQATKMREALPEHLQKIIADATKDGPIEQLYVPVDSFNTYFQSQGQDPRQVAAAIMGSTESYDQAVQTGQDLAIKTSDYATKLAPTEHNQFFAREIRTAIDAMNAREADELAKLLDEQDQAAAQQSGLNVIGEQDQAAKVRQAIAGQLQAAGLDANVAEQYATLYEGRYRARAERRGLGEDPLELFNKLNLSVTKQLPEILRTLGGQQSELDALLNRLRAGDLPKESDVFGQSLFSFLKSKGGLQDQGGELSSRNVDQARQPFEKNLIQKEGLTLDQAAELAAESGYLETRDLGALLEAIDKESRGTPVYAPGRENPQLFDVKQNLESLKNFLADREINLAQTSNEDIRRMLGESIQQPLRDTQGQTFQQAAASDTVVIDGVERPANNSTGHAISHNLKTLENFWRWFSGSQAVDEQGRPLVLYHGTRRADRIGDKFSKRRATSGPMAFFTSDRAVAQSYSTSKPDTSLALDDRPYETWFKYKPEGSRSSVDIARAWWFLTPAQQATMRQLAPRVGKSDDGTEIVLHPEGHASGLGSYDYNIKQYHGNVLRTLVEDWLNSGGLFNDEPEFLTVLNLAGFPGTVEYDSPFAEHPGVIPVYLAIKNPLVTNAIPADVVTALEAQAKKQKRPRQTIGADPWDKRIRDPREWISALKNDIAQGGNSHVWTSIPDWVTAVLKANGYDGIHDTGGKLGGDPHDVWVPFEETQVKSALGNRGTFSTSSPKILYQGGKSRAALIEELRNDPTVFWHGSPSGDLRGGHYGLHLGTYEAAKQALEARIGTPLEGEWDGTREYGQTMLGPHETGYEIGDKPHLPSGKAVYSDSTPVAMNSRPNIVPFRIVGKMSNTARTAHPDFKANGYMKAAKKKGTAKSGYFYTNEGEDAGSISIVVPGGEHLVRVDDWSAYYQGHAKGAITFGDGMIDIKLLEQADLSTFIHETGHLYLNELIDDALTEGTPAQLREDLDVILKWMGLEVTSASGRDAIRAAVQTPQHEQFARGFEAYALEGKAPSQALREAFARFRQWLIAVYRLFRQGVDAAGQALNVTLTKDVREVLDRMVATDDEINAAAAEAEVLPMFTDAEQAGMSAAQWKAYQELVGKASRTARETLQAKLVAQYQRQQEAWWKEARDKMLEQVTAEVNQQPDYTALAVLQTGKLPEGTDLPEGIQPMKLDRKSIADAFGKDFLKRMPRKTTATKDGMHVETAAQLFGYSNAQDFVMALVNARPKKQLIEAETDRRMTETYGDMRFDGTLHDQARAAVLNEHQEEVVEAELRAITKKRREVAPFVNAAVNEVKAEARAQADAVAAQQTAEDRARRFNEQAGRALVLASIPSLKDVRDLARKQIAKATIRSLAPYTYFIAAQKASKSAIRALADKEYLAAGFAKQKELINLALYREATAAVEESTKIAEHMRELARTPAQQRLGKAGNDFLEQVNEILERFEFAKVSNARIARRQSLAEWIAAKEAEGATLGEEFSVPEWALNETRRINYRELSYEELQGIRDVVKQIEHYARLLNKLIAGQKKADKDQAREQLLQAAESNLKDKGPPPLTKSGLTRSDKVTKLAQQFDASLLKMEQLVEWLDGGTTGPWHDYLWNPAADAQAAELDATKAITAKIAQAVAGIPKAIRDRMLDTVKITGVDNVVTRKDLLGVALNMGNAGNYQKLLKGMGWTDAIVKEMADHLTAEEWQFVQGVWDTLESLWPEIAKLQKRLTGLEPEKVEATPIETPFGTLRGGYYPIMYSSTLSDQGQLQLSSSIGKMVDEHYTRATTPKGHTKARTVGFARPFDLDVDRLPTHIAGVVKDLTHREWLIDANWIANDPEIRAALQRRLGDPLTVRLGEWVRQVVNDRNQASAPSLSIWYRMIEHARYNVTIVAMGFKASTLLSQLAGVAPAIEVIGGKDHDGAKWFAKGVGEALRRPQSAYDFMTAKSGEMRHRVQTRDRDIRDNLRMLEGKTDLLSQVKETSLMAIGYVELMVSMPSWFAGYYKGLAQGLSDEDAVRLGDRAVRLGQGAGGAKDLAAVAAKSDALTRLLTMFYTPFSALYGRLRAVGHDVNGIGDAPGAVFRLFWVVLVAATLGELASGHGPDKKKDEEWLAWWLRSVALYPFLAVPLLRDTISAITTGYGYQFTPMAQAMKVTADTVRTAKGYAMGDKELADFAEKAVQAFSYLLGLPTGQFTITGTYLYDLAHGNTHPDNLFEFAKGMLYKRSKDERGQ